jgi:hypothetical protein
MGSARHSQLLNRMATSQQISQLRTRLQAILDIYVKHRPNVQRALTAGFVAYCLGTTWMSLTGRGARGGTRERGGGKKGKGKGKGVDGESSGFRRLPLGSAEPTTCHLRSSHVLDCSGFTRIEDPGHVEIIMSAPRRTDTFARANIYRRQTKAISVRSTLLHPPQTPTAYRHSIPQIPRSSNVGSSLDFPAPTDGLESVRCGSGRQVSGDSSLLSCQGPLSALHLERTGRQDWSDQISVVSGWRLPITDTHRIVSSLVTAQPALFLQNLVKWLAIAIPATYTNSMLEYLQSELGLAYRTR